MVRRPPGSEASLRYWRRTPSLRRFDGPVDLVPTLGFGGQRKIPVGHRATYLEDREEVLKLWPRSDAAAGDFYGGGTGLGASNARLPIMVEYALGTSTNVIPARFACARASRSTGCAPTRLRSGAGPAPRSLPGLSSTTMVAARSCAPSLMAIGGFLSAEDQGRPDASTWGKPGRPAGLPTASGTIHETNSRPKLFAAVQP